MSAWTRLTTLLGPRTVRTVGAVELLKVISYAGSTGILHDVFNPSGSDGIMNDVFNSAGSADILNDANNSAGVRWQSERRFQLCGLRLYSEQQLH